MTEIEFQKKDFNAAYIPYLDNAAKFLVFYGGAGSGKSVFIAQRYIYLCLKEKYFRLVYCRKVANTIRNSQFQLFKDLITRSGLDRFFQIKEGNMEIVCSNGNKMIAFGLDNVEKIKSIQEPSHIWVEEMTECDKQDITQLMLRLRTNLSAFNQLVGSFNPITSEHWIYESLVVNKEFECEMVKTTYKDNMFLPEAYRAHLEALKNTDENYYKVYCLGEWGGKAKGAIYTHWNLCDHIPQFADYIYGLDFGFNNPTALVKIGIVDRKHMFVKQLIYKSGLTNADLIAELKKLDIGKLPIYADAAEPQRIEEIYRAGFNCKAADKDVVKGIDTVKSLVINITDDSPDLLKEIRNYKWAEDKNGNTLKDVPVKFMDHLLDATRYAIHTHIGRPTGAFRISFME